MQQSSSASRWTSRWTRSCTRSSTRTNFPPYEAQKLWGPHTKIDWCESVIEKLNIFRRQYSWHKCAKTLDSQEPSLWYNSLWPEGPSAQPPEAHTAQWDHEYGRLAINSPRTGYEPNMAGNLTPLATHHTNTSSRRPSLCAHTSTNDAPTLTMSTSNNFEPHQAVPASPLHQQLRKESDARASVYHSEREDTSPIQLSVRRNPEQECCWGRSEKQVQTWLAQGKDMSPQKEGELKGMGR